MYVTNFADNSSFPITGIAFVDGQKFDDPGDYKTEVSFYSSDTDEYIPGKVATNFCDERISVVVEGSVKNIECIAFTVSFDADDFEDVSKKNDDTQYWVDITLTDSEGQKYTETLYSDDDDFNGNNSGCVRVAAEEHRVYLTIK